MPGDRDRLTFDAKQKYRSVVAQQGRVMVPADFNEAQEIAEHEEREEALDFVGPSGTPHDGYAIGFPGPDPAFNFTIGPGTMYVGGERVEIGSLTPKVPFDYFHQPDWLDPAPPETATPSQEYIFLTLREQEIGATEDPNLKDVALGGPDTTQRTRLIQQIERHNTTAKDCDSALTAQEAVWQAGGQSFNPANMRLTSLATLKVGFDTSGPPPSPCDPVAQGGYLGAENQLIRVRISGAATFVWGFDNASFLYRVTLGSDNQTLTLDAPPVDSFHFPKVGQAVEVLRTQAKLADGEPMAADVGQVFTLTEAYNPDAQTVKLPAAFTSSAGTPQLFLRVWEREVGFTAGMAATLQGTGIQVTLQAPGSVFHIGDFWAFAVRPSTPVQVYPKRYLTDQPPDGPRTWVCPLAIIGWTIGTLSSGFPIADCRNKFDNLVNLTKRKSGASCCTLLVKPEDLTANTLQSIIDKLKGTQSTICLQPGSYPIPAPLVLTAEHSGLTIEGCHGDVIIARASIATGNFLPGLIFLNRANDITLRGIRFDVPDVEFVKSGGRLADIPPDLVLSSVGGPDTRQLHTAIGIRLASCANTRIESCRFNLQVQSFLTLFEAGIFAMGDCPGLIIRNNQFIHSAGQPPLPALPGEEVRFGLLMVPTIFKAIVVVNPASNQSTVDAVAIPAFLDNAVVSGNAFSGLTAAALIYAEIGDLRIESNTVRACYAGIQLFTLRFLRRDDPLTQFFGTWMDYPFAVGSAIGQGFPLPPGLNLSGSIAVTGKAFVNIASVSPDPMLISMVNLDSVFTAVDGAAFTDLPRRQPASIIANANEIELILPPLANSGPRPSGSAFVYWNESQDTFARLVLSGNSMRGQLSTDRVVIAAVMHPSRGAITGNLFLNELAGGNSKLSLVVLPATQVAGVPLPQTQVAVTGNTMRGTPLLPPHLFAAAPFDRWEPLNLIMPS